MDLEKFLEEASYEVGEILDDSGGYRAILGTDIYDMWFIYQEDKITRCEAYCDLYDESIMLDESQLKILENWLLKVLAEEN
jgi:hypothetical protein